VIALHTFGVRNEHGIDACPLCPGPHGGPGPCDHHAWSRKQRRFIAAHIEEFTAAYENPDQRAASHIMARLTTELQNLPRGHICSEPGGCPYQSQSRGIPACPPCRARWQAQATAMCAACSNLPRQFRPRDCGECALLVGGQDFGVEIGRTTPVNAPMPMTLLLDFFAGYMG
jgi:hypothetical protein